MNTTWYYHTWPTTATATATESSTTAESSITAESLTTAESEWDNSICFHRGLYRHLQVALLSVIALTGFLFNTLVVVSIALSKKLHVTQSYFIASLSASDIIRCAVYHPFHAYGLVSCGNWQPTSVVCFIITAVDHICNLQTLLSFPLIAYNRYVLVAKPQGVYKIRYTPLKTVAMVMLSWTVAAIFVVVAIATDADNVHFDIGLGLCGFVRGSWWSRMVTYFELTILLCCFLVSARCYIRIFRYVKLEVHNKCIPTSNQIRSQAMRLKATKSMLLITLSFTIFCAPYFLLLAIDPELSTNAAMAIFSATGLFLSITAVLNPLIYSVKNKPYRQAMKSVMMCRMPHKDIRDSLRRMKKRTTTIRNRIRAANAFDVQPTDATPGGNLENDHPAASEGTKSMGAPPFLRRTNWLSRFSLRGEQTTSVAGIVATTSVKKFTPPEGTSTDTPGPVDFSKGTRISGERSRYILEKQPTYSTFPC